MKKEWIVGFVNGEGCFTFGINRKIKGIFPLFSITLTKTDLPILIKIKNIFKVGSISINNKHNSCSYQVTSSNVNQIIKFFNNKLIGNKLIDFENWKIGIELWEKNKHHYSDELANSLEKLNPKSRRKLYNLNNYI